MKRVGTFVCLLFAGVGASAGLAQASSVDWKFYGGASVDADKELCFYEADRVEKRPDGHMRVWTKCLAQKNMDSINIEKDFDGAILHKTADKMAHYYVPPIAKAQPIDLNQSIAITGYEETANISNIQPRARIFYELNCSDRMLRELSIYIVANGKSGSIDKPGDWSYVPSEGNAASLITILCPLR